MKVERSIPWDSRSPEIRASLKFGPNIFSGFQEISFSGLQPHLKLSLLTVSVKVRSSVAETSYNSSSLEILSRSVCWESSVLFRHWPVRVLMVIKLFKFMRLETFFGASLGLIIGRPSVQVGGMAHHFHRWINRLRRTHRLWPPDPPTAGVFWLGLR